MRLYTVRRNTFASRAIWPSSIRSRCKGDCRQRRRSRRTRRFLGILAPSKDLIRPSWSIRSSCFRWSRSGCMSEFPQTMFLFSDGKMAARDSCRDSPSGCNCLALQQFEAERKPRDLDGLRVDVHAVDVVQEDFTPFFERETPNPAGFHAAGIASLPRMGFVIHFVVSQQQVVDSQQKCAAAAGDVGKSAFPRFSRATCPQSGGRPYSPRCSEQYDRECSRHHRPCAGPTFSRSAISCRWQRSRCRETVRGSSRGDQSECDRSCRIVSLRDSSSQMPAKAASSSLKSGESRISWF